MGDEGHEGDEEEGSDEGHEGDEEEGSDEEGSSNCGAEGHEGHEEEGSDEEGSGCCGAEGHEGHEEVKVVPQGKLLVRMLRKFTCIFSSSERGIIMGSDSGASKPK